MKVRFRCVTCFAVNIINRFVLRGERERKKRKLKAMKKLVASIILLLWTCLFFPPAASDTHTPAKRYTVNLDLKPEDRWVDIVKHYESEFHDLLTEIKKLVPPEALDIVSLIGGDVEKYIPYPYSMEILGIAQQIKGISKGDVILGNMLYEVTAYGRKQSKACTSIVAEVLNGTIFHGRNLDYSFSSSLRNMTIIVDFVQNGNVEYTGTTFAGFVGLMTGQKPHGYTITLDERDQGKWWMNAMEAIVAGTQGVAAFRIRDALANPEMTFEDAVRFLADEPLIAPCYIIIGGTKPREGVVITRDRIAALDLWRLDAENGRWYLVETNYDHWVPPPSDDNRRDPAINAMNNMTREKLGYNSLISVLSTPPVLNDGTTYTVFMSAAVPELYHTWVRHLQSN